MNMDSQELKMREVLLGAIRACSPDLLVLHNVYDADLGYYAQMAKYGTDNPALPEGFPDFPVSHMDIFTSHHGYISVHVNERREATDETGRQGTAKRTSKHGHGP